MRRRSSWIGGLASLVVAGALLTCTSLASAADFTWSGLGSNPLGPWSDSANWQGGSAPRALDVIGTLTFPQLSDLDCPMPFPTHACNTSNNDVGAVSVDHLVFGDHEDYQLTGSALRLGSGGLSAGSSIVHLELPISLSASQTWDLGTGTGDTFVDAQDLSGGSANLNVRLTQDASLSLVGDNELGDVTVSAGNADNALFSLFGRGGQPARLNAGNGHGLTLDHAAFQFQASDAVVGALRSVGSAVDVGDPFGAQPGTLSTPSASFDADSQLHFHIANSSGTTVGTDYAQLRSTGNVTLGDATLAVEAVGPSSDCFDLPLGQTYTLISTSGSLSGTFGNAPEGSTILDSESGCARVSFRINYQRSGPIQTVTATVVPTQIPVPLNTALPQISGSATVGAMLSGSTGSWGGDMPQMYNFQWLRDGGDILGATSSSYLVSLEDQGHQLAVAVTATNESGSASATSVAISVPPARGPTPPPPSDDRSRTPATPPSPPSSGEPRSPVASAASVGRIAVRGAVVLVPVSCSAGAGCGKITASLSVLEQLRAGSVVAIAAKKKRSRTTRRVVVGNASVQLEAGQSKQLRVGLNGAGRMLLRRFGKLRATLRVAQDGKTVKAKQLQLK